MVCAECVTGVVIEIDRVQASNRDRLTLTLRIAGPLTRLTAHTGCIGDGGLDVTATAAELFALIEVTRAHDDLRRTLRTIELWVAVTRAFSLT